jgi:two-component system sensor histidine kinase KdpD
VVGLFLLFAVLQLLSGAAERNPQSAAVHGGGGSDEPSGELDEEADRDRSQTREGDGRSLRLLAPAGGGIIRADIYLAIEQHLASLVQRKVVLFGAGGGNDWDANPDQNQLSHRLHAAIADVQAGRTLATTVDDGAGDIWLVRRVSQKTADFGVIAIDLGSVPSGALDEVRQRVDDALSDAAATLERLDVARALNDARMRSETELLREALIGSVSHELRTPLASILGAATVLSKSAAVAKDERLTSLAGVVWARRPAVRNWFSM